MIPSTRKAVALFPVVLVAFALLGCGSKEEGRVDPVNQSIAQVRVEQVNTEARMVMEEVVGTVQAKLHATLEARLSGRITRLPVVLGERVEVGALIAQLDAAEIEARLEQAEASLEQADRDWKRMTSLFEQQAATRAERDAAHSRYRQAQGAVAEAKAMMSYVKVVAPFNGVITKKWVEVGDIAGPGKPLVAIEDPSNLQLQADVPQAIAAHLQRDVRLAVRVDGLDGELSGAISEIAPTADPLTRTVRIKVDLPEQAGLRSGQFARMAVPLGESPSLRVPESAVIRRGQLETAYVVSNGQARLHLVKTGKRSGGVAEILSGLSAGDVVVVEGAALLSDGQRVEVK